MRIKKLLLPVAFSAMILLLSAFSPPGSHYRHYEMATKDTVPGEDSVFAKVEIEASFPGGDKAWHSFLEKNLNGNVPVIKKAPAGQYMVMIQFVVDTKGHVSNITALTNHGYGMEEEVIRVIKLAPRWNPASQDGRLVKAFRKQPVTFWIEEEKKKKNKNKD